MPLRLHIAESIREACTLLSRDENAAPLAGGTLLVNAVNNSDIATTALVGLERLGLRQIRASAAQVTLGAMTTMADIAGHPKLGYLAAVVRAIGGPAVRAMATVGGNLHAPSPYGDLGVALLALDASVTLAAGARLKSMPLAQFYGSGNKWATSLVTSVSFKPPAKDTFRFFKAIRRHPVSASVLSIAVVLSLKSGKLNGVCVAYGAMAPTPIRAEHVEAALEGRAHEPGIIAGAIEVALHGCAPVSDAYASAWYRRELLPVHLARILAPEFKP